MSQTHLVIHSLPSEPLRRLKVVFVVKVIKLMLLYLWCFLPGGSGGDAARRGERPDV